MISQRYGAQRYPWGGGGMFQEKCFKSQFIHSLFLSDSTSLDRCWRRKRPLGRTGLRSKFFLAILSSMSFPSTDPPFPSHNDSGNKRAKNEDGIAIDNVATEKDAFYYCLPADITREISSHVHMHVAIMYVMLYCSCDRLTHCWRVSGSRLHRKQSKRISILQLGTC
jgi:hypothetical protein